MLNPFCMAVRHSLPANKLAPQLAPNIEIRYEDQGNRCIINLASFILLFMHHAVIFDPIMSA